MSALENLSKQELLALIRRCGLRVMPGDIKAVRCDTLWARYQEAQKKATAALAGAFAARAERMAALKRGDHARILAGWDRWDACESAYECASHAQERAFDAWNKATEEKQ